MSARIIPLILREANDFVEAHHRHSSRTSNDGGKFAIGLEHDGQLVGVAIVGRPVARMLQHPGTAELLRCCIGPGAPLGAGFRRVAAVRGRQWDGSKRGDRPIADQPKFRWEADYG